MSDTLRWGLFLLSACLLFGSSLGLVRCLHLGGALALAALWIIGSAQLILSAQVLSLVHALDWPGFLGIQSMMFGLVAVPRLRRQQPNVANAITAIRSGLQCAWHRALPWNLPALFVLCVALAITASLSFAAALIAPPNSWDSLLYHLSRVGYYLQFRSLDHYPTHFPRQVVFPANAEILMLWTVAFLQSDRLAGTVQLAAWGATTVSVYALGRRLRLEPPAALFGASCFALLPVAVMQSNSTLNDLVVASYLVASLLFTFLAAESVRPGAAILLAVTAAGLAVGTKPTAPVGLPAIGAVALFLFLRRSRRAALVPLTVGACLAVATGGFIYLQNWYYYGAPLAPLSKLPLWGEPSEVAEVSRPLLMPPPAFTSILARNVYAFVLFDLSGPLVDPTLAPVTRWLVQAAATLGEQVFRQLQIPIFVPGIDHPSWLPLNLHRMPILSEFWSGCGPVGAVMSSAALLVLLWPGRVAPYVRLLALTMPIFLVTLSLMLPFNLSGGRFFLAPMAMAAPLLGLVVRSRRLWWQAFALALAVWSGASGVYSVWSHPQRPLPRLFALDRRSIMLIDAAPLRHALYRELDDELPTRAVVGIATGDWDYPFFGPRFERTLLPLVDPMYAERHELRRPLGWTNQKLLAAWQPSYVLTEDPLSGPQFLPDVLPGRCVPLPLRYGKPLTLWELWRCEDHDPRSLLANGTFTTWSHGPGPFLLSSAAQAAPGSIDSWHIRLDPGARLQLARLTPPTEAGSEPFQLRIEAGGEAALLAGIVQTIALDEDDRPRMLVVDARIQASEVNGAVLQVSDRHRSAAAGNVTTAPETLRIWHPLEPGTDEVSVRLLANPAGRQVVILARSIVAVPRRLSEPDP
jgi:hypothetical protein